MKIFVQSKNTIWTLISLILDLIHEMTKNGCRNNYNMGQNKMVDNVEEDR